MCWQLEADILHEQRRNPEHIHNIFDVNSPGWMLRTILGLEGTPPKPQTESGAVIMFESDAGRAAIRSKPRDCKIFVGAARSKQQGQYSCFTVCHQTKIRRP